MGRSTVRQGGRGRRGWVGRERWLNDWWVVDGGEGGILMVVDVRGCVGAVGVKGGDGGGDGVGVCFGGVGGGSLGVDGGVSGSVRQYRIHNKYIININTYYE